MAERPDMSLIEEINKLASGERFVAFTIITASGQQYEINAGDYVAVGRGVITIARRTGGYQMLRQGHVTEVNVPENLP
jgi:hypothetical protein